MNTLQDRIKQRRLSLGLTLAQIAEKLDVKEATVQRYESGEIKNIKHETILKLSQILNCDPSYLMCWTDTPHSIPTVNDEKLSFHEKNVIKAYRDNPDLQPAVDKLLSVPAEEKVYNIKVAARNGEFVETTITDSDLEKIKNLPDADGF